MRRIVLILLSLALLGTFIPGSTLADEVFFAAGGWEYSIRDGNAVITRYDITNVPVSQQSTVIVPSTMDGYPVTVIGENAFFRHGEIQQLTIPGTVTAIEKQAFLGCSAMTYINLPEGLVSIGQNAFRDCSALDNISFPSTLEVIDNMAFNGCSSLSRVALPFGFAELKTGVFQRCTSLTSVDLPETLSVISNYAFALCNNLSELTLPFNVAIEGNYALPENCILYCFADSQTATQLEVFRDPEQPDWELEWQVNGVIAAVRRYLGNSSHPVIPEDFSGIPAYDIAPDALINAPLDTLQLPTGTQEIGEEAFCGITACAVVIPASVDTIGSRAFAENDMLYYVYLPARSIDMAGSAFDDCEHAVLVTNGENAEVRSYAEAHSLGYLALE